MIQLLYSLLNDLCFWEGLNSFPTISLDSFSMLFSKLPSVFQGSRTPEYAFVAKRDLEGG